MSLSARLRDATRELHREAERSALMSALLRGRLAQPAYASLLVNLQAIYAALEAGLAHHDAELGLDFQPYLRSDALARDLARLGPAQSAALAPAAQRYVARLRWLDRAEPELLLAHAYVRYLGDLHGGQALRGLIARAYALPDDAGTDFYRFGSPDRVAALIEALRIAIDAHDGAAAAGPALLDEARLGFRLHVALFGQLAH